MMPISTHVVVVPSSDGAIEKVSSKASKSVLSAVISSKHPHLLWYYTGSRMSMYVGIYTDVLIKCIVVFRHLAIVLYRVSCPVDTDK